MDIRYVIGNKANSTTPIALIRIELTIEEAKELEQDLLRMAMNSNEDLSKMKGFIAGMVAHLDEQEIPTMPGLQESIELITVLRKLIDGRATVALIKRSDFPFAKEYLDREGFKFSHKEDMMNDTYTIAKKVKTDGA